MWSVLKQHFIFSSQLQLPCFSSRLLAAQAGVDGSGLNGDISSVFREQVVSVDEAELLFLSLLMVGAAQAIYNLGSERGSLFRCAGLRVWVGPRYPRGWLVLCLDPRQVDKDREKSKH